MSLAARPEPPRTINFPGHDPRRTVEAVMKTYFLVAKNVGDLTRIFCAALEDQNKKRRPTLASMLPGFLKPRTSDDDFVVANGRLTARDGTFRADPVNMIRSFHITDAPDQDVQPRTLRTTTRAP